MADVNDARDQMQDILNQHEYQVYYEDHRSFLEVWWDRLKAWLKDLLNDLFPSLGDSSGFSQFVLFLVVAVVIALVGFLVYKRIKKAEKRAGLHIYPPFMSGTEKEWTYKDHLQKANTKEESQNYTEATRHLFLALLLYFHEKELLIASSGKTNWDYVAEIGQENESYADMFFQLALTFDKTVYGQHILQHDEFMHFRDNVMKLIDMDEEPVDLKEV